MNDELRKEHDNDKIGVQRLLSPKDVAEILGISVKTVNKLVREGKLGCVQVTGRDRRFTGEQLQAYVEARTLAVRVDTKRSVSISSVPQKGGEIRGRAKSFEAQVNGSLVEEMKALCR